VDGRVDLAGWIEQALGHRPRDPKLFARALTHSSRGEDHYERLEFLGDRVLGLAMATWLFELYPDEPEGKLSRRFNVLVSGETCAEVARELGVPDHVILGKQAREDGASDSDNVLGDITEALIGALYLEAGLDAPSASSAPPGRAASSSRTARPSTPSPRCRNGRRRTIASRPSTSWSAAPAPTTRPNSSSRSRSATSARPARRASASRKRRPPPPRPCSIRWADKRLS
jgi:hypothetical protein